MCHSGSDSKASAGVVVATRVEESGHRRCPAVSRRPQPDSRTVTVSRVRKRAKRSAVEGQGRKAGHGLLDQQASGFFSTPCRTEPEAGSRNRHRQRRYAVPSAASFIDDPGIAYPVVKCPLLVVKSRHQIADAEDQAAENLGEIAAKGTPISDS